MLCKTKFEQSPSFLRINSANVVAIKTEAGLNNKLFLNSFFDIVVMLDVYYSMFTASAALSFAGLLK